MLETFRQLYGSAEGARIYRAPGRVNLIGEHTDYTLGFVLPVALDLATHVAAVPSPDGMLRIYSQQRVELREFTAAAIPQSQPAHHWTDYPICVAVELARAGCPRAPANLLIPPRRGHAGFKSVAGKAYAKKFRFPFPFRQQLPALI